jgi:hypothetical protein
VGEPELIINVSFEQYFQRAQVEIKNNEDLNERFSHIIKGFEEFNPPEFFERYKFFFESILQDMLKFMVA